MTRQWFSVRTADDELPLERALGTLREAGPRALFGEAGGSAADADGASVALLGAARHARKLRRGTHVANAFEITLRDVRTLGAADAPTDSDVSPALPPDVGSGSGADAGTGFAKRLATRLEALRDEGFPNYLGPQRFGHGGRNVERARAWFRAPRRRATRQQRSLWLSAARSALFNDVCAARVANGSWFGLLDGEPVSLDGSRSFFVPGDGGERGGHDGGDRGSGDGADDGSDCGPDCGPDNDLKDGVNDALAARLARGDVHPSGPWWGRGESPARGDCAAFEREVLAGHADLREGLERAGLEQARRALRARPAELRAARHDGDALTLSFALAPGTFATTLLAELGPCARAEAG